MTLTLFSRSLHYKYSKSEPCVHSTFFPAYLNIIRKVNIFCINVDIHKMLLLQKKKGQGINTVIVIPLYNSLMSVMLLFFLSCLIILGILYFAWLLILISCCYGIFLIFQTELLFISTITLSGLSNKQSLFIFSLSAEFAQCVVKVN